MQVKFIFILVKNFSHIFDEMHTSLEDDYQMLDLNLLIEGLNFYRLLIDCSPPASIPNISFMVSFQELVSYFKELH